MRKKFRESQTGEEEPMNRKEAERKIRRSFENAAPDRLDDIKKRLSKTTDADSAVPMHMGKKKRFKDNTIIYSGILAAVAAVLLIINGILIFEQGNRAKKEEMTVARTLTLDLENSVALDVNAVGQVVTVKTLDKDTADIINSLDLAGTPSDVAVNAIVGAMYQKGCLGGEVTDIVVTESEPAAEPEETTAVSVSADDVVPAEEAPSDNNADDSADDPEKPSDVTDETPEEVSVSVDSANVKALANDNGEGKSAAISIALADAGIKAENAVVTRAGLYTLEELIFNSELTEENSTSDNTGDNEETVDEEAEEKNDEKKSGEKTDENKTDTKTEDKKSDDTENADSTSEENDDNRDDTASEDDPEKNTTVSSNGDNNSSIKDDDKDDSASDNDAEKKESSSSQSKKTYISPVLSGLGDMKEKVWFVEFTANGYTYCSIINLEGNVIYYSRKRR